MQNNVALPDEKLQLNAARCPIVATQSTALMTSNKNIITHASIAQSNFKSQVCNKAMIITHSMSS